MTPRSTVTRLRRNTQSAGASGIRRAAASSGARPVWYTAGSYPSSDMVATSDPLSNPSGTVRAVPTRPWAATQSMFGVAAAASGVSPPSSASGSSAAPSGMRMAYLVPATSVMGPGVVPTAG